MNNEVNNLFAWNSNPYGSISDYAPKDHYFSEIQNDNCRVLFIVFIVYKVFVPRLILLEVLVQYIKTQVCGTNNL